MHGFASGAFGLSAEQMAHLSDDRIGRALDRLFDADRAALLTEVVVAIGQRFQVNFERLHNDSTSIAFCGQYRAAKGRAIRGPRRVSRGPWNATVIRRRGRKDSMWDRVSYPLVAL